MSFVKNVLSLALSGLFCTSALAQSVGSDIGGTLVTPDQKHYLKLSCIELSQDNSSCFKAQIVSNLSKSQSQGTKRDAGDPLYVMVSEEELLTKSYVFSQLVNVNADRDKADIKVMSTAGDLYLKVREKITGEPGFGRNQNAGEMIVVAIGAGLTFMVDIVKSPFVHGYYALKKLSTPVDKTIQMKFLFDKEVTGLKVAASKRDLKEILETFAFTGGKTCKPKDPRYPDASSEFFWTGVCRQ